MLDFLNLIENHSWEAALAAALLATMIAGAWLVTAAIGRRARRDISEQHNRLDGAINNMNQGLCMFDAQNRLIVWNRRYVAMYGIAADRIRPGCTIRDLLDARIAAGTFPLDPGKYDADLRDALKHGKAFVNTVELADGRCIAVVNQPMAGGGWVATHEDVTERVRAERELARTRAFLDAVVSNVPTPIIVKSLPDMHYLLINKEAEKFLGMEAGEVIGKTSHDIMDASMANRVHAQDMALLEAGHEVSTDEHVAITPNGETHVMTSRRLPVLGADGKPEYLIIVLHDLTDRKRDAARISYLAHHDPVTDLPNRPAFNQCLRGMFEIAGKSGESFAVLCMDVDRFKAINDTFGSVAGDAVLKQLAGRLQQACEGAFLARIGGDEFCVVSPTGPQPNTADALAARLREAVAADLEIDGQPVNVSLTIGIAIYPNDAADATGLLANAEAALFRAKAESRGTVRFFAPEMDRQLRDKRALQHDLRLALANGQFELYYQPQSDMDGTIIGFEALARWHHPRQGVVPPATFIPLAEESGLIMALGDWVLRTACKEAASWPRPLRIAVNLSAVQFQHGELVNLVHETLLESGLSPGRLEIEITEGVLIGDFSRGVAILRRIKNMGVRIAMDDFGTGYSSLSYLQSFPFDKIKIDQVFIANLMNSPQSAAIVRAVIGLGQGLQLPVIAEGVETQAQRDFLVKAACNGMQGYLIGRPQPIAYYAEAVGRTARNPALRAVAN
jgi:diguanylate cyclase (GGDEF)-like protein/PAS domain S-box-containing protein